jgi:AraC-like DNA-binding protein
VPNGANADGDAHAATEPLAAFPAVRSGDVDELRERLSALYSVRRVDLGRGMARSFEGRLNHRQLSDVGLTFARYGTSLAATVSQLDSYIQGFPIRGAGSAILNGSEHDVLPRRGALSGPGSGMAFSYSPDFEHVMIRISPRGIVRKLSALIGAPVDPPVSLAPQMGIAEGQQRLIEFALGEFSRDDGGVPPLVLAELEQALIVAFLCNSQHNYSQLLRKDPRALANWQVRRVEEYVEQNCDQPLTIEALAMVANVSVRSLFYSFQKSLGTSPMTFVKQVRVRRARAMLTSPEPGASVSAVAFDCGFSNLGHFARYYRDAFGELPSETLARMPRDVPAPRAGQRRDG